MKNILIVEDDVSISDMIVTSLSQEFSTTQAFSGREALFHLQENQFDLVLLDLMLPGLSGEEAILEIKQVSAVPIIIMSALSSGEKIVELLEKGANDYITKPFDINVLKARINTQLRLIPAVEKPSETLTYGNLSLSIIHHETLYKGVPFTLAHKELQILETLMSTPQKIYSKADLYEIVWEDDYLYDENTMNVHLSALRRKVKKACNGYDPIETIWGIGIRMNKDTCQ